MDLSELDFEDFDRYLLSQNGKIIIQNWLGRIPNRRAAKKAFDSMKKYRQSWIVKNPGWFHIVFDWNRSRELIKHRYPEHLAMYDSYEYDIQRSDAMRYFALHRYGGLYADMDYICCKPWDEVVQKFPGDVYLVETPNKTNDMVHVSNSLMFSRKPGNPFWCHVFVELENKRDPPEYYGKHMKIMVSTGPIMLNHVYHTTRLRYRLGHYNYEMFHPKGLSTENFTMDRSEIYAYHRGNGSWEGTDSKILIFMYQEWRILSIVILGLVLPSLVYHFLSRKKIAKQD